MRQLWFKGSIKRLKEVFQKRFDRQAVWDAKLIAFVGGTCGSVDVNKFNEHLESAKGSTGQSEKDWYTNCFTRRTRPCTHTSHRQIAIEEHGTARNDMMQQRSKHE